MNSAWLHRTTASTIHRAATRACHYLKGRVALLLLLLASTAAAGTPDLFSGTYHEIPRENRYGQYYLFGPGEFTFTLLKDGSWKLSIKSTEMIYPPFLNWTELPESVINQFLDEETARSGVRCISPRNIGLAGPVFCNVPVNTSFGFRENRGQISRGRSETGFFMILGTPAGVFTGAMQRLGPQNEFNVNP